MFCQFKDILGKPNTGSHSYRIFNIAIVDVLLTLLGAYLIIYFNPNLSFTNVTIGLFLLGIIMHRLFCVRTTIDKLLFK